MANAQARPEDKKSRLLHPGQKTLVVGLGGTGKRVLVQLKRRLLEAGYLDSTAQPDLQLICLDFDPAEECAIMRSDGQGKVCLAADETCWLDGNLIHNRLRNLRQEHNLDFYRDWYPDQEGTVIQMGAYRAGAAQWRPLGRIGYYEYAERIQVVLRRGLNRLLEVNLDRTQDDQARGVAVYIVCSLAGGTGGGIFMDVAYFLRTMPVDLKQFGLLLLPGIYAEYDISGRLYANTYACLKELSVFANQGEVFDARYPNGRRINVPRHGQSPFDQLYLFDNIIQADEVTSNVDVMSSIMAETVFFDISEAKLADVQQSAATNVTELAGAHEDTPLARQSVFSMVGSLTLLLPARAELEAICGQLYLNKVLILDMQKVKEDQKRLKEDDPDLAQRARDSFAALDGDIDRLLQDTRNRCLYWDDRYLSDASQELGGKLLGFVSNPAQAIHHLDRWLEELQNPQREGGFSDVPLWLPEIGSEGSGPLKNAIAKLGADLSRQIEETLRQGGQKGAPRAEDLYYFLKIKAKSILNQVSEERQRLAEALQAPRGTMAKLKDEFQKLCESKPPTEGGLNEKSALHWAKRFMVAVQSYYTDYACAIRVHTLLAAAIDQAREERLVDERTLQAVLGALSQIKEGAEQKQKDMQARLKQSSSATVRSLVDQSFLDNFWQRASAKLPTSGGLMDFLAYLKVRLKPEEFKGGGWYQRLPALAQEFSQEMFRRSWQGEAGQGLDLHEFVSTRLRAQELGRARHDYMVKDALLNTSKNHRAYAALPSYSRRSSREDGGDIYQEFKGLVDNALEASTIQVQSYPARDLAPHEPGKILVRHVSLNHPATNLRGIGDYYFAYARYGANRKLFHIDLNFMRLPEVIDEQLRLKYVTCGNPGCHEDITEEPRGAIICRHCHRPIRSRCGNHGCPENELHKPRQDWDPQNPDKYCPTCHQPARTYWWRCKGHNLDLRTESNYCQHCLAEHRAGLRSFENVSRRDDVKRHLDCPGCLHDCQPEPFRIEFLEVYDEVPDQRTPLAWEIYSHPTRHGYCPKCGAQLLPFCPYHQGDERPHFVHRFQAHSDCQQKIHLPEGQAQRREGPFFCTSDQEHAQKVVKECSYCHLPLKGDATYCPRCKRQRLDDDLEDPRDQGQERKLDVKRMAERLGRELAKTTEEQERAEAVAESVKCRVDHHDWLWFGLSQEDWDKMKGTDEEPRGHGPKEARDCEPKPVEPPKAGGPPKPDGPPDAEDGLPPEAAVQYRLGHQEETHEPA
ncbi:MAG: hypothetical protein HY794_10005 [Desulfarculus sp.]|nr:hypothetical protein [Desulfarculus sp.]